MATDTNDPYAVILKPLTPEQKNLAIAVAGKKPVSSPSSVSSGDPYASILKPIPNTSPTAPPVPSHTPLPRTLSSHAKEFGSGLVRGVTEDIQGLLQTVSYPGGPFEYVKSLVTQTGEAVKASEKIKQEQQSSGRGQNFPAHPKDSQSGQAARPEYYDPQHPSSFARRMFNQAVPSANEVSALIENLPIVGGLVKHVEGGGTRMLSPEATGATAEAAAAFYAPEIAMSGAGAAVSGEGMRGVMQGGLGAGKEFVKETATKFQKDIEAGAKADIRNATTWEDAKAKLDATHATDVQKAIEKHGSDTVTRDTKIKELETEHAAKVAEARKKWVESAHEKLSEADTKAANIAKRAELESGQETAVPKAINNLKSTYEAIKEHFKPRWQRIRDFVKDPETGTEYATVKPHTILDAINNAREKLAGTPPSLTILNQIENALTEKGPIVDEPGGPKAEAIPKESISFEAARVNAHEVLDQAYHADDPLTSKLLFDVYEAYDKQLREAVKEAGIQRSLRTHDPMGLTPPTKADIAVGDKALAQYDELKGDWKKFKTDWDDKGAVSKSASPLVAARQIHPDDPGFLIQQLKSPSGNRLVKTLGEYTKFGGDAAGLAKIIDVEGEIGKLPEDKTPTQGTGIEKGLAITEGGTSAPSTPLGNSQRLAGAGVKPFSEPSPSPALATARISSSPESVVEAASDRPTYPPKPPKTEVKAPSLEDARLNRAEKTISEMQRMGKWDFYALVSGALATPLALMFGGHPATLVGPGLAAVVVGKMFVARMMENPKFLDWIKQGHIRDLPVLEKFPESIQAPLREQINKHIEARAAAKRPITVGGALKKWLAGGTKVGVKAAVKGAALTGAGQRDDNGTPAAAEGVAQ